MLRYTTTALMATMAPASPDSARLELSITSSTLSVTGEHFVCLPKSLFWSFGIGLILADRWRMPSFTGCPIKKYLLEIKVSNEALFKKIESVLSVTNLALSNFGASFSLQLNCKGGSMWTAALWPTTTVSTTTICLRRKRPENNLDPLDNLFYII